MNGATIYRCSKGHELLAPPGLDHCLVLTKGKPCTGTITAVPRRGRPPKSRGMDRGETKGERR